MPPISILVKPVSGNCNMRCRYCFYADEIKKREVPIYKAMTEETLENIIRKTMEYADKTCVIGFQGGEPTLAGLSFFKKMIDFEKKYNTKHVKIEHTIQTNGLKLNEEWVSFFKKNHFLVGLSIDGPAEIHDQNRIDTDGKGTFGRVLKAINLLKRHNVEFNILTVVTRQVSRNIHKIYNFYIKNKLEYQQYIPCLDPLGEKRGIYQYSLCTEDYLQFITTLFDLWMRDIYDGKFIYIRYFENLIAMLSGKPPESCGLSGHCTMQHVIEADGSIYPCDFYMLDEFCVGNLNIDTIEEIHRNVLKLGFVHKSYDNTECHSCDWNWICHGGCRRDRQGMNLNSFGRNYYCDAYQKFFSYAIPQIRKLLKDLEFPPENKCNNS